MEKIKIEIFGIRDRFPAAGGCGCGPSQTMIEMYDEFMYRMKSNELYEHLDISFIDYKDDIEGYDHVKSAILSGFNLPLTAIDGRIRFHNSVPFNQIVRLISRQIK
ncbi:hypothetical protein EZV73_08095 [Acidaminobacter sp. JC074]|uniref:hypothetical protein n=1 Tax=Acidaminobacter sp. JC074 TaxID=2530199 RepID=UPI001F1031E2|nr:hypothetical protein [Acidaminobacter sp. JC074]MCH4887529.1 hypothetical protein [Acidaminobacter sp. JC074]